MTYKIKPPTKGSANKSKSELVTVRMSAVMLADVNNWRESVDNPVSLNQAIRLLIEYGLQAAYTGFDPAEMDGFEEL